MSLKFGIYLVEQRIISPEQFCGLIKIQQEAIASIATIALRQNTLSIKQVASILDVAEVRPDKSFVKIAMELDLLDRADADQLLHQQQLQCPSLQKLIVECGLLTQRQTSVLNLHFERNGANPISTAPMKTRTEHHGAHPVPAPSEPVQSPAAPVQAADPVHADPISSPRQPNFRKRPVVVRQYTES